MRNALLNCALEILVQEGLDALSLRAVARRAGVSQAAPYHHFKDKRALMAAVATTGHLKLAETARTFRDSGRAGLSGMIRMGAGYVAFAKDHPTLFRLMFGDELTDYTEDSAYNQATRTGWRLFRECLSEVMEADGETRKEEIERAALVAWCFIHGLATLIVDNKIPCPDTSEQAFLDFVFGLFAVVDPTKPAAS